MSARSETATPRHTGVFASKSSHKGAALTLIGQWQDIVAYYAGSDGNVWAYQRGALPYFSNCGPVSEFRANFAARQRGNLFS